MLEDMNLPMNKIPRRVLGIDPGFDRLGIAVIEGDPSKPVHVWSDCVNIPKGTQSERLACVYNTIEDMLTQYAPTSCGIEGLFFSTNKKTALSVAEARGAVLSALGNASVPVFEFSPAQVKLAVTGYGKADKVAVSSMVPKLLVLPVKKRLDDEFDAIAVALACLSTGV
jgi:crossover junction endodeoxyribonuclease RuvC